VILQTISTGVTFEELLGAISFEQRSVVVYGKTHLQPRLTKWYGPKSYTYSGLTWPAARPPESLEELRLLVKSITGGRFNSVLCNLYRNGVDRIHWHSDDEPEFGSDPEVASLSFGSARTFRMRRKDDHKVVQSFELGDQSLLYMPRGTQRDWEHSVPKTTKLVGPRINLTFRNLV
jgi:alkylated DNA repair dioxygenase AlkB